MNRPLVIRTPAGERRLAPEELPARIGSGADADIRVPGAVTGEVVALVGSLDGKPFLQPTGGATPVAVNGEPVRVTRWLADGDVVTAGALGVTCEFGPEALRLVVAYADAGYPTLPPVAPATGSAGVVPARARAAGSATRGRPRWHWLAAGAFVLLLTAASHLFTARTLGVAVEPVDATVRLGGSWLPLRLGGRYLLRPGSYRLSVEAEGYAPLEQEVTVGDAPRQELRLALRPLPGKLLLDGAPAGPIGVSIDGRDVAPGPGGEYVADAGRRRIEVRAPRHLPFAAEIDVAGRGLEQRVAVALTPNWADVTLASEPPGAEIRAGDASLGLTPATVAVDAGTVDLTVRKEGYKTWRRSLALAPGQKLELPIVRLQETDGLLTVRSVPAGAAVTVDGRYRGATPLETEIAPERSHEVIVAKPGYETATRAVRVERRGSATLELELAARVGIVRVTSEPPDAEVWIDGSRRGRTGEELRLPAVVQRIEVRKEGFAPFTAEITPRPGMPQLVEARLLTPGQAVVAAAPATTTTHQGLVLRLVGPGEFEMGAPRREQGRRPNETQRRVRLTRSFYIGTREVTNREFRDFRPNHGSGAEKFRDLAGGERPAVMLSWEDAVGFCNWLSAREGLPPAYATKDGVLRLVEPATTGFRLPTEAEWEWASRYNGGGGARRYPWGNEMPPVQNSGNFADQSARGILPNVLSSYDDGHPVTAPVGSFAASALGLYDIGGNAAEWVHDFYTVPAATPAPAVDPAGPAAGQYHVIRGSSWRHASISELRLSYRDFGNQGRLDVGFRIARYAE